MDFHETLGVEHGSELFMLASALNRNLNYFSKVEMDKFPDISTAFSSFEDAFTEIEIQTRIFGGVRIPDNWFPSPPAPKSTFLSIPASVTIRDVPNWRLDVEQGFCSYSGQLGSQYEALEEYVKFLIQDSSNHKEIGRTIWMAIDWCMLNNDIGGAIDGIRLVKFLPEGFPDIESIFRDALESRFIALQIVCADHVEFHPAQNIHFIELLKSAAINAPNKSQATHFLKALRIIGSDEGFNALLYVATNSPVGNIKSLATTALAWSMNIENIEQRLKKLVFSKNRKISKIASRALTIHRKQSIYSYGAPLATKMEYESWGEKETMVPDSIE